MTLWDFLVEKFFPLFGSIPEETLADLQSCFWCILAIVSFHFLIIVPYKGILALIRYRKWGKS